MMGQCLRDTPPGSFERLAVPYARRYSIDDGMMSPILERAAALMPAMTAGRDWKIHQVTRGACDLLGKEPAQIVGRDLGEILGLDVDSIETDGDDAFDARCEAPVHGVEGVLPLRLRGALLTDEPQGIYAAFCLIDLSSEQQAAAEIRSLSAQLHHVWRLNSLGEMAMILAHELNQPLTAATSYLYGVETGLAKLGLAGQSAAHTAALAKGQVLRAGEIIRRMRNLLSTGSDSLTGERVSLVMDELGPVLNILARDIGATLDFDIDPFGDAVLIDRIQLQQAIVNLVRNGIEAAVLNPAPHVRVTGVREGGVYRISIEDSGPGIPGGDLAALLQPLISTKPGGMGLGLSITRTILERHGCTLQARTGALGGAVFWFDLATVGGDQHGQ